MTVEKTTPSESVGGAYHVVAQRESGQRLDRWFRNRFPGLGHGRLAKMLRQGQIRIDGARVGGGARLEAGQKIRVPPLPSSAMVAKPSSQPSEPVSDADAAFLQSLLLYQDDSVLVLNKPSGLAVQGGSGLRRHLDGMLTALRLDSDETPRLTHRLDRDVSGVLVLGRSAWAASRLCEAFRERHVEKLYWALTLGVPKPGEGFIETAMEKTATSDGYEKMSTGTGKAANSRYMVIEAIASKLAWVGFVPESGRTHQLRVHAAELGCPILGDGKYGGREARLAGEEMGLAAGLHLHARRLRLPHPENGILDVSAPPPEHMLESWQALGLNWRAGEDSFARLTQETKERGGRARS